MKYYEILSQMTACAREVIVLHTLEEIITYLQREDFGGFPDLLKALSDYVVREQAKERDQGKENNNWETVNQLLCTATDTLKRSYESKDNNSSELSIPNELAIVKLQSRYYRELLILNFVSFWMEGLEDGTRHRFSDILKVTSNYANTQSVAQVSEEFQEVWKIVASILAEAAKQAESEGVELS